MKKNLTTKKMFNAWALGFLLLSTSLFFTACRRGSDSPITTPEKFKALTADGFNSLLQTTTFDASKTDFEFTTTKGTKIFIDGTCLRKGGMPVSGLVTLSVYEAYERKDMLIANAPLMGRNWSGEYEPLKTGGQFFIKLSQDGEELTTTCLINMLVPASLTGGFDPTMSGWKGEVDENGNLLWAADSFIYINPIAKDSSYDISFPEFCWMNCDRFYSDPRPKAKLAIAYPAVYENACVVYALIKGEPNTLGLATYGKWPIGMELHLVFVAEEGGAYKWIAKDIVVEEGQTVSFLASEGTVGTRAELLSFLSTLD